MKKIQGIANWPNKKIKIYKDILEIFLKSIQPIKISSLNHFK